MQLSTAQLWTIVGLTGVQLEGFLNLGLLQSPLGGRVRRGFSNNIHSTDIWEEV